MHNELLFQRIKRAAFGSALAWGMLLGLLSFDLAHPTDANAALPKFLDAAMKASALRTTSLRKHAGSPLVMFGATIARRLHFKDGQTAWDEYQAVQQEITATFATRESVQGMDLDFIPDLIRSLAHLWLAENRLRWIFFRDTTLAVLVIGKAGLIVGGLAAMLWRKRGQRKTLASASDPNQLPVMPDQPLDIHLPEGDPTTTRLYQQAEAMGFLSPLTGRIIVCFAASPDHPASLQDHLNLPGGLIEHTARTIQAIAQIAEGRPDDEKRLCYLMALCHDLGKLFAYERAEGQWVDRRLFHDRLSALMVASLPELYTELSLTQREALILALRYYHNPEELPTTAPPMCYMLFEQMHKADATAYEQEKELGRQQVEGVKPHLWKAFCSALPQLNINRYRGGYPEGFTSGEIVFVLEHALRERTLNQLSEELQQKLPIRRPSGRLHPAWPLLVEVMKEKNILVEQVKGRKTNPSALFNITASGTTYKCVVALSLGVLATLFPEAVAQWKQCPSYEVQIAGGRYGE